MKRKTIIVSTVFLIVLASIFTLPIVGDLWVISETKGQYMLDKAVHEQHTLKQEISVEKFLNPPFLKKYGLDMDDYLDKEGYFSPKGNHWIQWNLTTKAVAVLMWSDRDDPSPPEILDIIRCANNYIESNERSVAILKVVKACKERD